MKMRRPHRIPLPTQAVALLRALHLHTGTGRLAFPSVRSTVRSISENTLNAALRRMGYTTDEVTAHGFRATASTPLNESSQWHADAIRRAYARGEHWEERVRMMQWWADKLEAWKGEGRTEALPAL